MFSKVVLKWVLNWPLWLRKNRKCIHSTTTDEKQKNKNIGRVLNNKLEQRNQHRIYSKHIIWNNRIIYVVTKKLCFLCVSRRGCTLTSVEIVHVWHKWEEKQVFCLISCRTSNLLNRAWRILYDRRRLPNELRHDLG